MEVNDLSSVADSEGERARALCIESVVRGLEEHDRLSQREANDEPLVLAILDENKQVAAGLLGKILRSWLRIDMLWVAEKQRGMGYGKRLMRHAEEIASARGCRAAHVDTYSYQAPDFYQELGYQVFAQLADYPPGETKFYLKKSLVPSYVEEE